jgi:hypothetical protein
MLNMYDYPDKGYRAWERNREKALQRSNTAC